MPARTVGWLLWLAVGVLAALALFWQIRHPPQPPILRAVGPPPALPAVTPVESFHLSPPNQYSEVVARPLFIAERRPESPPPDEAPPEKPPPGSEQKFVLFGVMIAPGNQAALLRLEEPNAKTARVRLGEMIAEWRLDQVTADGVVLRRGEATQELPLTRPRKPGKPRAKRTGPQPGQSAAASTHAPVLPATAPVGPGGMPVAPPSDGATPLVAPAPPQ